MTLPRLLQIVRRGWPVIVVATLLGAAGAYAVSERATPIYSSTASVYFALRQGGSGSDLNQGSAYTQAQVLSFATLATSSITLDRVIDDLDLGLSSRDLARNIEVTIPQNTVILDIAVSSRSPERAAEIANSVASNLSSVVVELAPSAADQDATVSARVIEPAVPPLVQSSPNTPRDTALGALLGLLAGALACVLFAVLETRVRSAEVVGELTAVPLLGQIGRFPKSSDSRPVMVRDPNGSDAESFRRVRAALAFTSVDDEVRAILITSGAPGEGKTTLAVNLALAVAESGARVLLIDADLRRPQVAAELGVDGSVGLTTVLVQAVAADDAVRRYGSTNLDLLLSGDIPPNPAELLSSLAMAHVIADFAARYDLVIVDTAPALSVVDASLLSPHVDLSLVVVDALKTKKNQLAKTLDSPEMSAFISGIVLNRAKLRAKKDVYYGAQVERDRTRSVASASASAAAARPGAGAVADGSAAAASVISPAIGRADGRRAPETAGRGGGERRAAPSDRR